MSYEHLMKLSKELDDARGFYSLENEMRMLADWRDHTVEQARIKNTQTPSKESAFSKQSLRNLMIELPYEHPFFGFLRSFR